MDLENLIMNLEGLIKGHFFEQMSSHAFRFNAQRNLNRNSTQLQLEVHTVCK